MSFELLYETITGQILEEFAVADAENLFEDGKPCDVLYAQVQEACARIREKPGAQTCEELDLIVDSMDRIGKAVAHEVFRFCVGKSLK